jgi:hypothetical protein
MSWNTEIVTIVRHLIDDTDFSSPRYPDERIEQTILVAAQLIQTELNFETTYSINVEECHLNPDPTLSENKDDGFINLTALKAAVIVVGAEYRAYGLSSVKVTDGPSSIDMTNAATHMKHLYDTLSERYEQYKLNFAAANNNVGKAILSPYGNWRSQCQM